LGVSVGGLAVGPTEGHDISHLGSGCEFDWRKARKLDRELIEQAPQVLGTQVGVAQDAGEGAATEFSVQGND
jgi:hypothetical protein